MKTVASWTLKLFSILLIQVIFFSCERAATPDKIYLPQEYQFLIKHGWYLSELRDTSYTYYDTVVGNEHWPGSKHYLAKEGLVSDPCTLNTFYYFKKDGTITKKDCNGIETLLIKWAGVQFVNEPELGYTKYLLYLNENPQPVYIPFLDTIPAGGVGGGFEPITDISDSTKLVYFTEGIEFWTGGPDTPRLNDSTVVYGVTSKVKYRVARHN